MNLSPEVAALICVGSGAGMGILAYGINRLVQKHKKVEPPATQAGSLSPQGLELSKKVRHWYQFSGFHLGF